MTQALLARLEGQGRLRPQEACVPSATDNRPVNNARLIAELQAVTIGIHLVGLERLPTVMGPCAQINGA